MLDQKTECRADMLGELILLAKEVFDDPGTVFCLRGHKDRG